MKYELIESPTEPGHWHVEAFTEEGECVKAVFSGPKAFAHAEVFQKLLNLIETRDNMLEINATSI